jgi:Derlin-2/3
VVRAEILTCNQGVNYFWTGATVMTSALILAFIYTGCQDDRAGKFNFMVVNIPAQWAPVAMIFITFIMSGPGAAKIQSTGLFAAHFYDFMTRLYPEFGGGKNILVTPQFVKRWFSPEAASASQRSYGTAFTPADRSTAGASSGADTGGVLPETWRNRGSGHRLGGE